MAAIAAVGVLLGGVIAAGPASASVVPARPVYTTTYKVIDVTSVGNVDYAHVISRCYAVGGTCSITKGKTATVTVGVSLGWSRAGVSAGLSMSNATAVTISVSCNSPRLKAGTAWTAYAVGRYYTYRIQKTTTVPSGRTITKSGVLHAFSPYKSQIYCK